nr:peptidase [Pseudalkalibacillus caeni]
MVKQSIQKWMEENKEEGVAFLQKLVQYGSVQGKEKGAQEFVAEKLKKIGMEVDKWIPGEDLVNHPYFCSPRTDFSESPNVVGIWKGKGGGRSIVLNGHIDVVPPGNPNDWKEDPFSGLVQDGKVYGRGVTDMKGGNTSLLLAIQCLKDLGIELKGDVLFHSVIEEESGGAGTLAAVLRGYTADAAIIPEPTNMKIFPKQQGSMWFRVTVNGQSAHGGTRYEGVSAIEKSMIVLQAIQELEKDRNEKIDDPLYSSIPIPVPINVGKISGGDWPSSVCDTVTIEGRMGVSPEEKMEEAQMELQQKLENLQDEWLQKHPVSLEWFGARWHPGNIDPDHELMHMLQQNFESVTGEKPVVEASPWGTDGGLLTQAGDTPSIVFGPGVTGMAHYSNEYIEIDKVFEAAQILALTILDWCEGGEL